MCGRTACALAPATLEKACSYKDPKTKRYRRPKWRDHPKIKSSKPDVNYSPSYNIFPTRFTPILFKDQESGQFLIQPALWKLIPPWHKGEPTSHDWSTFNCRIEGLPTSKLFRPALVRKRCCIIPIQGFYEWRSIIEEGSKSYKQPYFVCMSQNKKFQLDDIVTAQSWQQGRWNGVKGWQGPKVLMLAGLYNVWRGSGDDLVYSYTIITKPANKKLAHIHSRMPVILKPEQITAWLRKEDASVDDMMKILQKSAPNVSSYTVSTKINNARCNYEGCIQEINLKRRRKDDPNDNDEVKAKRNKSK